MASPTNKSLRDFTDAEWLEFRNKCADFVDDHKHCENFVTLQRPEHYIPDLDRCQLVLGGLQSETYSEPWLRGPYGTNIQAIARCSRCRTTQPNRWLRDVPLERFKWFMLGQMTQCPRGGTITLNYEGLR